MKTIITLENYNDEFNNNITTSHTSKSSHLQIKFLESHAQIIIGENTNLTDSEIILGKGARLVVGSNSVLKGRLSIGSYATVKIGDNLSVTHNLYIRAVEGKNVSIGNDCLIASDVTIRTNDGHPIYDTTSGVRINMSEDVVIGNHVWLGDEVAVLKGVSIGEGSIVAMRSVVTKNVESKVIAAGIPAKIVRFNCTWEHNLKTKTQSLYD
ncbi:DapH/DapD/GlmU-related protein [Rahnella inusitata]|uniref:acyltransferase n=1 Tax=Rahnella inusitata TaxID=58169 RepID=UPI0039BDCC91